ncbi:nucleotide sugar dehydrogenase [Caldisericum sp.]|uniref:nucleotide sugar dehydrogenase n=1 Tax=Caldisericum sp. TaxID=2499687 RepID=UPI003D0C3A20
MNLKTKILNKEAKIGVIGLGYVGLPLAMEFAKNGYKVIGFDTDREKVNALLNGNSYVADVTSDLIVGVLSERKFLPTYDFGKIQEVDVVIICVPTPLRKTRDPDISYILSALNEIKRNFHKDLLIILESTTYPGTTEELIKKEIEDMGYKVGEDFYLCFSPERVDPGNKKFKIKNTPKVIGGVTPKCLELGYLLYSSIIDYVFPVSSPKVAEMAKLLENTFRAVNIALANELAIMCDRMGIDIWEVVEAASTKPFGFMAFYPGPGAGGHCIPLDSQYLSWKAKSYNFYSRFIELASDLNDNMPRYVLSKISEALNYSKKCINSSKILILGMSYKKDVDDIRESPSLEIYKLLKEQKAEVEYNDPYVSQFYDENKNLVKSVSLDYSSLSKYDCVVLCTDHSCYDYDKIFVNSQLIVDTRNAFKDFISEKLFKIGAPSYNEDYRSRYLLVNELKNKRKE